ncbi:hypothetical protein ABZZ79_06885 [Streptomyces sp. NPDC006458]|uniref:hypothetical protein n=1 Tax=Streptomyces sp. NPDC006458 TaxID=3154302 RepID=UPI00339DC5EF
MTSRIAEKPALRVARTGWAKARRLRREGMRMCVAAVVDESASPAKRTSAEWNIVRGED